MRGIPHKRDPPPAIVPGLGNPVADIGLVHFSVVRHPHESRVGGLAHAFGTFLDQGETLPVADLGVVWAVVEPGHGHVEDP